MSSISSSQGPGSTGSPSRERVFYPQFCVTLKVRLDDFARGASPDKRLQEFYEFSVTPKRCSVSINDYTEADAFDLEIDYKALPFDPRCIRSVGVTVHAEDMYRQYLQDGSHTKIKPTKENTIFLGFADEESIHFSESERTVKMEGRDNTCLLIDQKYPKGTIDVTKELDKVVQGLLDEQISTRAIKVVNNAGTLPILSAFYTDKFEGTGKKNVKREQTYWDVIQDIVRQAGLIAYIYLDKLIITKPRVLYNSADSKTFIYGHNIKDLQFKRKIGRRKGFNLAVRGMNIEGKNPPVFEARIPVEASEAWSTATGYPRSEVKVPQLDAEGKQIAEDQLKPAPYITFLIPNVASKAHLVELGQQLFEEIGRQQIEGSFATRDLSVSYKKLNQNGTPSSVNESFNVFKLRNGTPVSLILDQGDLEGITNLQSTAERSKFLQLRGWNSKVAQVFAETMGKYANTFYTRSVKISMSAEDGVNFDVDFLNFIEVSESFKGKR
jgi:hypothetical protein